VSFTGQGGQPSAPAKLKQEANMKKIEAIIKHYKLDEVRDALNK